MKKILLVLTGGTICAFSDAEHTRGLDVSRAKALLEEGFRASDSPFAAVDATQFAIGERFDTLSENMTFEVWNRVKTYLDARPYEGFDGVVIAHGTDTLGYSAAMFAMLYAGVSVPMIFVAADAPLDDERGNGNANFRAAVECICRGITPGVYAVYRNSDGATYLHAGSRLTQCAPYRADFYSEGMTALDGSVDLSATPICNISRRGRDFSGKRLERRVLKLDPYVGTDYRAYDLSRFDAVLHGAYHSGTVCTSAADDGGSAVAFAERCAAEGKTLYISPAKSLGGEGGDVYESVLPLVGKARFLWGMTAEAAYAKLTIAYSCFDDDEARREYLAENTGGEYIR